MLRSRGYEPVIYPHAYGRLGYYSGTADERFADLSAALTDPSIKAILCSRGGYGAVHLLERLNTLPLRDNPKWLIGFSDITALHAMMLNAGVKSIHGAMAKYMWENPESNIHLDNLMKILGGGTPEGLSWEKTSLDINGTAEGILAGGNMAVFNGLNGSRYDIGNIPGHILFIEDVGEEVYRIERMLYNMRLNGTLAKAKGIIVGQFTEYDKSRNAETMEQMIKRMVEPLGIPVAFNAPFGHGDDNMPLIEGAQVRLTV